MPREEYIKWFKKYRIKNKDSPVYKDIHSNFENTFNDQLVLLRQKFINILVKVGVKR